MLQTTTYKKTPNFFGVDYTKKGIATKVRINYTTFGSILPGRSFSSATGYPLGFNGMRKDNEIKGSGNSYDFGARIYDPRLGRWLSLDPLMQKYPDLSPYNFCNNNPIMFVDPDGQKINWFMSRGALQLRKAFIKAGLRDEWKALVNSQTKITIIVSKDVLIQKNKETGVMGITEGQSLNDPKEYSINRAGEKPKQFLKSSILIISLGVYELKKEIMEYYNVTEWKALSKEQRLAGISKFSGHYYFIDNSLSKVNVDATTSFELGGGKANGQSDYYRFSVADPLTNEAKEEYLARVGGHEGKHSVTASENFKTTIIKISEGKIEKYNETKFSDLQEKSGYAKEGEVIEKEQSNRVNDNK